MEYEIERNTKWQMASVLATVAVIGGAMFYAFS